MKKSLDIEKLLQWALCEELPKGNAVTDDPAGIIARLHRRRPGNMAASIGKYRDRPTLGFVPGTPHRDALIVGSAVHSVSEYAKFYERAEVLPLFGEHASIAGEAADALLTAFFNPRALLISCAILSSRPKWQFPAPAPHQMMIEFRDRAGARRRRPRVHGIGASGGIIEMQPRRGRAAMRDGVYDLAMAPRSPIDWDHPLLISIGRARAEYVAWHAALVNLSRSLVGKLTEFEPLPPAARPMPWAPSLARILCDDQASEKTFAA